MRILIATDGSGPARIAIELVAGIRWSEDAQFRVLTVMPYASDLLAGPWPSVAVAQSHEIDEAARAQGHRFVAEGVGMLTRSGSAVEPVVIRGRAADGVIAEAEKFGADLIVVGSRGRGGLASMLLGSVSSEVVDRARVPVLVARVGTLRSVLIALDGSETSWAALRFVESLGVLPSCRVRVVSVAESRLPWWTGMADTDGRSVTQVAEASIESRRGHETIAAEAVTELERLGITTQPTVVAGDPAEEIIRAATESETDLIVLGSRGLSGLTRLVLGSVGRNVLHHAPCSVLLVPPTAASQRDRGSDDDPDEPVPLTQQGD